MEVYIADSSNVIEVIKRVIASNFKFEEYSINTNITPVLNSCFDILCSDLHFVIETDYVDKVYRDSYYLYFSSKRNSYHKDCIKVSLFNIPIEANPQLFYSNSNLKNHYLGFIILRPTSPYVIGRSIINPNGLKRELRNFRICCYFFNSTSNSIKLKAFGFPHSSQETETITCAETALWLMMEYFGTRYPDYKPLLPSHIINILKSQTSERQIPSQGQAIYSLSFALKELGFGPKIYSRESFKGEFDKFLKIYIESGIPIILGVDNEHESDIESRVDDIEFINHAVLCIGRRDPTSKDIEKWLPFLSKNDNINLLYSERKIGIDIYDYTDICNELVLMDDNRPAYQIANINHPTSSYCDASWDLCKINHFIVPLYKKIYLEAQLARDYFLYLLNFLGDLAINKAEDNLTLRFFLASSRSYKEYIVLNEAIDIEVKEIVSQINMGKFIWIAELSTKNLVLKNMVSGMIILDATEPNTNDHSPFIIAFINGFSIKYNKKQGAFSKNLITLHPFLKFDNLEHIE